MNANQQSALAALRSVSPIAGRLDRSGDGEDRAADILELWQGTETALRALMGGSSLGGQALIRELRQQELISLGQAYALLEFLGARDRANRTTYHATDNDVAVAREGFRQLEAGLTAGAVDAPPLPPRTGEVAAGAAAGAAAAAASSPYAPGGYQPPRDRTSPTSPFAPGAYRSTPGSPPPPEYTTPVEQAHCITIDEDHSFEGTWEEILLKLSEARGGEAGGTVKEFMVNEARRGYSLNGCTIPTEDAESFIRGSADAGLLRIVR